MSHRLKTYDYTPEGRLSRRTWARTATYAYNHRGRMVRKGISRGVGGLLAVVRSQPTTTNSSLVTRSSSLYLPTYDADGNQTLIQTDTGIWSVTYNGENRPVAWSNGATNVIMAYDRMGRRVVKNSQYFFYDGYLQIADNNGNAYMWDPTELVATRPLVWRHDTCASYYFHDGNKNVSGVVGLAAHYKYAPFGNCIIGGSISSPWQFSSESYDEDLNLYYYNFRHYDTCNARWTSRDPVHENGFLSVAEKIRANGEAWKSPAISRLEREMDTPYLFAWNDSCNHTDELGALAPWLAGCGVGACFGAIGGGLGGIGGGLRGIACGAAGGAISGCVTGAICSLGDPDLCVKGACVASFLASIGSSLCLQGSNTLKDPCSWAIAILSGAAGCLSGIADPYGLKLKLISWALGMDVSAWSNLCGIEVE